MATYHGGEQVEHAQAVLERHAVSSVDGRCVSCGVPGPCGQERDGGEGIPAVVAATSAGARSDPAGTGRRAADRRTPVPGAGGLTCRPQAGEGVRLPLRSRRLSVSDRVKGRHGGEGTSAGGDDVRDLVRGWAAGAVKAEAWHPFGRHQGVEPDWDCEECKQPWPCPAVKAALLLRYDGDESGLRSLLGAEATGARDCLDLTEDALHDRFVGWVKVPGADDDGAWRPVEREHQPTRPDWLCGGCQEPWPCWAAKDELRAHFSGDRSGLTMALAVDVADALNDLTAVSTRDVVERFVGWLPRRNPATDALPGSR